MKLKWVVEFSVDESWVADGFNLYNDEKNPVCCSRALDMLSGDLRFANIGTELGAKVLKSPPKRLIRKIQGYEK